MTPEQIAAEVSAKYGIPVDPSCVQIVPQGVSTIPHDTPPEHWRHIIKRQMDQAKKGRK